jgi:hypothetical protein
VGWPTNSSLKPILPAELANPKRSLISQFYPLGWLTKSVQPYIQILPAGLAS